MAIKTDAESLWDEVEHAEKTRDSHLASVKEIVETIHGSAYRYTGTGRAKRLNAAPRIENHPFEYVSLVVPRLIYDNPRFSARTKRMGDAQVIAEAIGHGLNRWILDVNLRQVLTRLAYDMLTCYSAAIVCQQPMRAYDPSPTSTAHRPHVTRLPPSWFGFDPLALDYSLAKFVFHKYPVDLDDLQSYAGSDGWDSEAIGKVGADSERSNPDPFLADGAPERNTVMVYEVWVPDEYGDGHPGPEAGFHGTIHTLTKFGGGGTRIREPRPFYGPPWGPYAFGGVYTVPDSPFPLSPLIATKDQQDEVAKIALNANRSAEKYKRLIFVDKKNPKLVRALKDGEHDVIIPVDNYAKGEAEEFEVGGLTAQMIEQLQLARERLKNSSGIDDAIRGNVTGEGTATEVSIAETAASMRMSFIKQQFADLVRGIGRSVAWYLFHDDRVVFPLGEDVAEQMGMAEPWFFGGLDGEDASFDDIELELDVYSMERTNEPLMQRNVTEALKLLIEIAQIAPTTPWLRLKEALAPVADVFNMPQLLTAIDEEMLGAMTQIPPSQPEQPQGGRLAQDVTGGPGPGMGVGGAMQQRQQMMGQGMGPQRPMMGQQMGAMQGAARRAM